MGMNVQEAVEYITGTVRDSGGAGVWTADFFIYVLQDIGEEEGGSAGVLEQALKLLVEDRVMEKVGRNGYQVREDWLAEQGTSVEELGT